MGDVGIWTLGAHPAAIMNEVRGRNSARSGRCAPSARPMWSARSVHTSEENASGFTRAARELAVLLRLHARARRDA